MPRGFLPSNSSRPRSRLHASHLNSTRLGRRVDPDFLKLDTRINLLRGCAGSFARSVLVVPLDVVREDGSGHDSLGDRDDRFGHAVGDGFGFGCCSSCVHPGSLLFAHSRSQDIVPFGTAFHEVRTEPSANRRVLNIRKPRSKTHKNGCEKFFLIPQL